MSVRAYACACVCVCVRVVMTNMYVAYVAYGVV